MKKQFTAIIVKQGEWYAGSIKEVPGAISQARTIEELRENLKEAIQMVLESDARHLLGVEHTEEQITVEI